MHQNNDGAMNDNLLYQEKSVNSKMSKGKKKKDRINVEEQLTKEVLELREEKTSSKKKHHTQTMHLIEENFSTNETQFPYKNQSIEIQETIKVFVKSVFISVLFRLKTIN